MMDADVIIIGGGPGGYIAAERLGDAGKSVLLIEEHSLGGACLTAGCVPTAALSHCVEQFDQVAHAARFGVRCDTVSFDWTAMQHWKARTVSTLVDGVIASLKRSGVTVVHGRAKLVRRDTVEVDGTRFQGRDVIIATGSTPLMPPIPGTSGNPAVVDSTGLLQLDQVPRRLGVVGGGTIGLELAALFARLGTEVTLIEKANEILPDWDADMAKRLREAMKPVEFHLGAKVERVDGRVVVFSVGDVSHRVECDVVVMAVGRQPAVRGWGAETVGLAHDAAGVVVDDDLRTNLDHVWAVGDVTGRSQLASAAYRMGEVAAALIIDPGADQRGQVMRWDTIGWVVRTNVEAAGVGLTEKEGLKRGLDVATVTVPLTMSGRYVSQHGADPLAAVKLIVDRPSQIIRGIHVVGPNAAEVIWGAAGVLEMELTVSDLRQLVFPHPTVSEGIRAAAWALTL